MEKGFLPAQSMAKAFNMLRSNDLIWSYVVSNYLLGKEPFPFDLLYWNSDSTAMPARVHHYYLENFYLKNVFTNGEMQVRGRDVTIGDIKGPVFHIATVEDHIAPAASVYRGGASDEPSGCDLCAVRLWSYCRGGEPACVKEVPVLDRFGPCARDARRVEGRCKDDRRLLVALLGQMA